MNEAEAVRLDWLTVEVRDANLVAGSTLILVLQAANLPPYAPGAHVAVECGDVVRYYSLCDVGNAPERYVLGVKIESSSAGGSRWLAEHAKPGAKLRISTPRNNFPLDDGYSDYLFVSGGIGMTPILSMLRHLRERGVRAKWIHMCRSANELAFADWVRDLANFHEVVVHCDAEAGQIFDIESALVRVDAQTAVYCCGPGAMMKTVQSVASKMGRSKLYHFEFFSASELPLEDAAGEEFVVIQKSTGRSIPIPASKTMLAALRDAGLEMKSECEYGVCGWCAVGVIEGEPKHFDSYLTESERASGKVILPCVSRCASRTLTLDI